MPIPEKLPWSGSVNARLLGVGVCRVGVERAEHCADSLVGHVVSVDGVDIEPLDYLAGCGELLHVVKLRCLRFRACNGGGTDSQCRYELEYMFHCQGKNSLVS